jgi:hypothetical protein
MIMLEGTKHCTNCKKEKPLSRFWSEKLQQYVGTCTHCREMRLRSYRKCRAERAKQGGKPPAVPCLAGRPVGQPLLSGELAAEHDLLGLPPATLTVVLARPRPGDAGQRWLAIR